MFFFFLEFHLQMHGFNGVTIQRCWPYTIFVALIYTTLFDFIKTSVAIAGVNIITTFVGVTSIYMTVFIIIFFVAFLNIFDSITIQMNTPI